MQEIITFEIGGQTYKLTGNNKELTEQAARILEEKYNLVRERSVAATTRETIYMLSALNIAEELIERSSECEKIEEYIDNEVDKMIAYVHNELNHLLQK